MDVFDDVGHGEAAGFLGEDGVEDDLKEQISQLAGEFTWVAGFHGVEDFVGFLDQVFAERRVGLFAVPGATVGAAEASLEGDEFCEPFAGGAVAGGDGDVGAVGCAAEHCRFVPAFALAGCCFVFPGHESYANLQAWFAADKKRVQKQDKDTAGPKSLRASGTRRRNDLSYINANAPIGRLAISRSLTGRRGGGYLRALDCAGRRSMWRFSMTSRSTPVLCLVSLIAAAISLVAGPASAQKSCESLTSLTLAHTTITSATSVAAGAYKPPAGPGAPAPSEPLPAFCRVAGISRPTSDSEIQFEVWLPAAGWNGKYEQVGNGGYAGTIPLPSMAEPLLRGYATAGTDDGHTGGTTSAGRLGHPEKIADFGYRAVHETSVAAKEDRAERSTERVWLARISWAARTEAVRR